MSLKFLDKKTTEIFKGKDSKIVFLPDSLPIVPKTTEVDNMTIKLRSRFIKSGQIDNLIVYLTKKESITLGLWILGATFQRKYNRYLLKLTEDNSSIKEIQLRFDEDNSNLLIDLCRFDWTPKSPDQFVKDCSFYLNQKISMRVTNKDEDWFTQEQYQNRDVLIGFGGIGGSCLAAEFFLNMGLEFSNVNYEYIKYEYERNLANVDSCEMRVELIEDSI